MAARPKKDLSDSPMAALEARCLRAQPINYRCDAHRAPYTVPSARRIFYRSAYTSIAVPLNPCHLACNNIDLEGTKLPDSTFPALPGNGVVTGSQRNPKLAPIVSREGCNRAPFV